MQWLTGVAASLLTIARLQEGDVPKQPSEAGGSDIVIKAYPPRCRARNGDLLDAASETAPVGHWIRINQDPLRGTTSYGAATWSPDNSQRGVWLRAGDALPDFTFRNAGAEYPLCIGAKVSQPRGSVQFQQFPPLRPFQCKALRFTAYVASRETQAMLWINAGEREAATTRLTGNHGWTPIKLEHAAFSSGASGVGFGISVGAGDFWIYKPLLEAIPDQELSRALLQRQRNCIERVKVERRQNSR